MFHSFHAGHVNPVDFAAREAQVSAAYHDRTA